MNERRKVEERLKRKEQEIRDLEDQIKAAKIYVQALQDVLKLLPRDPDVDTSPETVLRPGSLVAQTRTSIKARGTALHVDEILRILGKDVNRENKAALSGSLAAYVRRGEIFTRPAPNTYGLVELDGPPPPHPPPALEPPPEFGSDDFESDHGPSK
jgi:hypothetical protein